MKIMNTIVDRCHEVSLKSGNFVSLFNSHEKQTQSSSFWRW